MISSINSGFAIFEDMLTEKVNNVNDNTKINVEIEKKEKEQAKGKKQRKYIN